jgi:hypothetical protein
LNIYTLDQDSVETGYGQHARVVAFHPDHEGLYVRVDKSSKVRKQDHGYPILREPTVKEILTVARKSQGLKGRWKLRTWDNWSDGGSIDYYFDPA